MTQVARNVTMADVGFLSSRRYLIHDRASKFCESFHRTIEAVGVAPVKLPARSPDLNSFAERWVKSVKEECLSTDSPESGLDMNQVKKLIAEVCGG